MWNFFLSHVNNFSFVGFLKSNSTGNYFLHTSKLKHANCDANFSPNFKLKTNESNEDVFIESSILKNNALNANWPLAVGSIYRLQLNHFRRSSQFRIKHHYRFYRAHAACRINWAYKSLLTQASYSLHVSELKNDVLQQATLTIVPFWFSSDRDMAGGL